LPLKAEVVQLVLPLALLDGRTPSLELVGYPCVVHLSGDDDALLHHVGGGEAVESELLPAVSLLASGGVADGGVGVKDQQDAAVALQVTLDCVVYVV